LKYTFYAKLRRQYVFKISLYLALNYAADTASFKQTYISRQTTQLIQRLLYKHTFHGKLRS